MRQSQLKTTPQKKRSSVYNSLTFMFVAIFEQQKLCSELKRRKTLTLIVDDVKLFFVLFSLRLFEC